MFPQAVPEPVRLLLPVVGPPASQAGFYLAGGTAAALQLGHRESVDLDFFSPHAFDPERWQGQLARLGNMQVLDTAPGTLHVLLNQVRLSFFHYDYPLIAPTVDYQGLTLASLHDISLMKIASISHRGARKDFVDLYVISTRVWPLAQALDSLPRKFTGRYSLAHLLRSLQYFEDAEREPMPRLIDPSITWPKIKSYFQDQVRLYVRNLRSQTEWLDR
ncbi:hypothetical protein caldi_08280 [Caldinitratiruptor microaerophilus]|uniref:Nucleotidyl transferase AbiEii toxin, Type IV TA system n=1 Tax=Caldinitratiruptor microaerophilus TaxID=671077 RepID=A0AA35CJX2_9FIRM|nr:hypothetical protein caldi_08280 [Caldinitratiruptor microaerophilus]